MRWEVDNSVAGHEIYHLFKGDKKMLTLNFNPFSNSARVDIDKEKRVLLIRKEGFMKRKTVLRSEYGIKIAELGHDNKNEFIDVNGDRFFYTIHDNPLAELILYKESKHKPLITCSLNIDNGKTSIEFNKAKIAETFSCTGLLMALCWYMFLPAAKETVPEQAI